MQAKFFKLQSMSFGIKERNDRVHASLSRQTDRLIKDIQLHIRGDLAGLDRAATSLSATTITPSSAPPDFTYWSTWFGFIHFATVPHRQ